MPAIGIDGGVGIEQDAAIADLVVTVAPQHHIATRGCDGLGSGDGNISCCLEHDIAIHTTSRRVQQSVDRDVGTMRMDRSCNSKSREPISTEWGTGVPRSAEKSTAAPARDQRPVPAPAGRHRATLRWPRAAKTSTSR